MPVTIHVPDATCKEDWYVKLNPNARIPTIDDDGFVMWESGAINLYLAKKYKSPLWPTTARKAKGSALQWGFYIANDVEPPMTTVFQQPVRVSAGAARRRARRTRPTKCCGPSSRCSTSYLAAHKYFGVDRWDMADFMVASVTSSLAR